MRHLNLISDQGNATLEFVLVVGLFAGPIVAANQDLTALNLRQVTLDSMSETIAREIALGESNSETAALISQLAADAALDSKELAVSIKCEPQLACGSSSQLVEVALRYKSAYSLTRQLMQDAGSMLPLTLGMFALMMALTLAGSNLEAVSVFDQRASQIARFLVQEHFADQLLSNATDTTAEALRLAAQFSMDNFDVSAASLERIDGQTLTSTVCAKYALPINFFGLGSTSRVCGVSKMRVIG